MRLTEVAHFVVPGDFRKLGLLRFGKPFLPDLPLCNGGKERFVLAINSIATERSWADVAYNICNYIICRKTEKIIIQIRDSLLHIYIYRG
jgi:hypothetical protein